MLNEIVSHLAPEKRCSRPSRSSSSSSNSSRNRFSCSSLAALVAVKAVLVALLLVVLLQAVLGVLCLPLDLAADKLGLLLVVLHRKPVRNQSHERSL